MKNFLLRVLLFCGIGFFLVNTQCIADSVQTGEFPDRVYLRSNTESFNKVYYAAVKNGDIWVKPNVERLGYEGQWEKLELINGLAGDVVEIAMDDEHIIALNSERQIYTMWNALDEVSEFRWQKEWGAPFWLGPGMKLTADIRKWDWSVVSPYTDENWTDPAGNLFTIGLGKCSHIWLLSSDGQRLTYVDPWLPTDYSYEINSPKRGRFQAVNMSSSGSYLFIINQYGDMYTRFYDFDIGGADGVFFRYSYYDQRGKTFPAIQLPPPPWEMHPKIHGQITDRISIHKIGKNCINRVMRVEGIDGHGNTGYYEKDVTEKEGPSQWVFHITDKPLQGTLLDNRSYDCSDLTLGATEDKHYSRNIENIENLSEDLSWWKIIDKSHWAGELLNFSCYNSPTDLVIHLSSEDSINLLLHTTESIRQAARARGLDDNPRYISGTIEVPSAILDNMESLSEKAQRFIKSYLMEKRFVKVDVVGTTDKIRVSGTAGGLIIWWEFFPAE